MAASSEQFGKAVIAAGLLSAEETQAFWKSLSPADRPADARAFAASLVKAGKLTGFQAAEILAGHGGALVRGDYVLVDKLGTGGMGEVFKARHRHMDRIVALKVMSSQAMKDEAAVQRFKREVRAAARLEHPNTVTAFDAGQTKGQHYLVMQYVDGHDLSSLVKKQGPLAVDQAINCILQTARGLAYAHSEAIIHRDIKPANLLLDKKGVVKILDMGLARFDDAADDNLTGTEQVMGTVDYMSPEQAASTHTVDARGDIYSLGCTLWHLLTGKKIFEGDTLISRMLKHREAPIPSLCAASDDVPLALELIYQQMVAKRPEDRYPSMDALVGELESLQANASGLSRLAAGGDSALSVFSEFAAGPGSANRDLAGASGKLSAAAKREPTQVAAETPTTDLGRQIAETDPKSEISVEPLPKKAAAGKKKPPVVLIATVGVLGFAILAGLMFKLRTKDGTLVVEVNQPDALIEIVDGSGKVEISQPGGLEPVSISVVPGKHRIRVEKDGFVTIADTIEISSGGKLDIKARLVPSAVALTDAAAGPRMLIAPFDYAQARAGQQAWAKHLGTRVEQKNTVGMTLVLIPPGEFLMGSSREQIALEKKTAEVENVNAAEIQRLKAEGPQHKVAITRPFCIGSTEVTVGQFKKFVEATSYVIQAEQFGFGNSNATKLDDTIPSEQKKLTWRTPGRHPVTDDFPATQVTWNDAVQFCNWLSDREKLKPFYRPDANGGWIVLASGTGYRLPTEAEWEYACRAGTTTRFSFGDDPNKLEIYAWFNKNGAPRAVGSKVANPFGLFDMHGNVSEPCQDFHASHYYSQSPTNDPLGPSSGSAHAGRSGLWSPSANSCRSAFRHYQWPEYRSDSAGFRFVREIDATTPETALATTAKPSAVLLPPGEGGRRPDEGASARPHSSPVAGREKVGRAHPTKLAYLDPAFQKWIAETQKLPADKQIEAVSKKLMELNPGFDDSFDAKPKIESGVVTELNFATNSVTDISPVRALAGLRNLACSGRRGQNRKLADLFPLAGMHLLALDCSHNPIRDLSPLTGMSLQSLGIGGTHVSDLRPLEGMPLTDLSIFSTPVSDLSPLAGMKLTTFNCVGCRVSDLSPLGGMPLASLLCPSTKVSDIGPLEKCKSLKSVDFRKCPVTAAGVAALAKSLPKCKIWWDDPATSPPPPAGAPFGTSVLTSPDYVWSEPENLGPTVNSDKDEYAPSVSADGLLLVFASSRSGGGDLFECRRKSISEPFGEAIALKEVNSISVDSSPFLTADGLTLLFSSTQKRSGAGEHQGRTDIYLTLRANRDAKWGQVLNLGPLVNSASDDRDPCLSPDGLTLYFTSHRPGSLSRYDLWRSRRKSLAAAWEAAENLGPSVNHPYDQDFPRLAADGRTLFYLNSDASGRSLMLATPTADGGWKTERLDAPDKDLAGYAFSADGRTL